jgi:hypothetical protein
VVPVFKFINVLTLEGVYMKNTFKVLWSITMLVIMVSLFASCGDGGGEPAGPTEPTEPPQTALYSGAAEDGSKYTLKVIEKTGRYAAQDGDSYILYLVKLDGTTQTSSGTVTTAGTTLTLKPANITTTFSIEIDETGITEISGTITFEDKTEVQAPGKVEPLPDVPENWPVAERWRGFFDDSPVNTATLSCIVDKDGVCAITVGGKAMPPLNDNGGTDGNVKYWNSIWRAQANYIYTIIAGKTYTYKFEAWTDGLDRALKIQYYWDNEISLGTDWDPENDDWENSPLPPAFKITSERKVYTITDGPLPGGDSYPFVQFQCANQTGTFYVKMLSIESF